MTTIALVQRPHSRHRASYLAALRDIDAVTAVAVVDPDGATLAEAREALPEKAVRGYDTFAELDRTESPEMAIVSLDGAESPGAILPLLEAGIPVLAEKPACVAPDDFARLVETAERCKTQVMLALCNRIAPWVPEAKHIVTQGGLGTLYAARVLNVADQARIWDPHTRDWTFRKATAGGGHLIWLGIHWLDMLLYLTGARVTEVQAMVAVAGGAPIDVEDLATVNLRLEGGALASLVSGYVLDAQDAAKQIDFSLWGAKGWLRFDMEGGTLDWHSAAEGTNGASTRQYRYDAPGGGYTPFVRECLRAIRGEIAPPVTGAEGLAALRVIFAAYRSAETGQSVRL